jgi:hypothetical protein
MDVKVLSRLGQTLSRRLSESSVVGNSMLVRLRSGTIGLLGIVTAVGLGMVMLLSQQGWPDVASGPLPPRPPSRFVQHETIAVPTAVSPRRSAPRTAPSTRSRHSSPTHAHASAPLHSAPAGESELVGFHQVTESTTQAAHPVHSHASHGSAHKTPQPASVPPPTPATPPVTETATTPPVESAPAPVTASAEQGDESPGHSDWHHGHYPAGSSSPWPGQEGGTSVDDQGAGASSSAAGDDGSAGDEDHCNHDRGDWGGH